MHFDIFIAVVKKKKKKKLNLRAHKKIQLKDGKYSNIE